MMSYLNYNKKLMPISNLDKSFIPRINKRIRPWKGETDTSVNVKLCSIILNLAHNVLVS
jgi:hypothetical protein